MSKSEDTAKGFMNEGSGKYRVLASMVSVTGRDLGALSMFGDGEQEVVFNKGTRFTITDVRKEAAPGDEPEFYRATWRNEP